ncbi:hypothetical protein D3C72_486150 [compost metagenome]
MSIFELQEAPWGLASLPIVLDEHGVDRHAMARMIEPVVFLEKLGERPGLIERLHLVVPFDAVLEGGRRQVGRSDEGDAAARSVLENVSLRVIALGWLAIGPHLEVTGQLAQPVQCIGVRHVQVIRGEQANRCAFVQRCFEVRIQQVDAALHDERHRQVRAFAQRQMLLQGVEHRAGVIGVETLPRPWRVGQQVVQLEPAPGLGAGRPCLVDVVPRQPMQAHHACHDLGDIGQLGDEVGTVLVVERLEDLEGLLDDLQADERQHLLIVDPANIRLAPIRPNDLRNAVTNELFNAIGFGHRLSRPRAGIWELPQHVDRRNVRGRPREAQQVGDAEPFDLFVLRRDGLAIDDTGPVGSKPDGHGWIGIGAISHQFAHLDAAAELFFDLAHQGHLGQLARVDLAARKLPKPRLRHRGRAQRTENSALIVSDDGPDDLDLLLLVRHSDPQDARRAYSWSQRPGMGVDNLQVMLIGRLPV